jgi:hypothetical protein
MEAGTCESRRNDNFVFDNCDTVKVCKVVWCVDKEHPLIKFLHVFLVSSCGLHVLPILSTVSSLP